MALLGKGVLAIWNGTTDAAEAEFVRWHVREHIPERVGLPGFLVPRIAGATAESRLRGAPDGTASWIVPIEPVDAEPLQALRNGALSTTVLERSSETEMERGVYRLQYALSNGELRS